MAFKPIDDFINKLWGSQQYTTFINLLNRIVLPGFGGVSLFQTIKFFISELKKNSITSRASSLAFNFFLAIFPAIIFLFTLIPYIPIDNFQDQLLLLLKDVLPYNAYEATKITLFDIIKNENSGLLSFGFITALFFSTNGVLSLIDCFNEAEMVIDQRSWLKKRIIALGLTSILSVMVIIAISLIVFSEVAINYLVGFKILKEDFTIYLLLAGKWFIVLALYFFSVSSLYYFGPAPKMKFRFISPGSTLATVLSIAASSLFAYYVNNFGNYNKLYGSIGTLVVVMLWLYFNSLILLIGFELNSSIFYARNEGKN